MNQCGGVVVEDFETGAAVEIPLDPKRSASENLEATFKRYQKLIRRLTKAGAQADEARAAVEALDRTGLLFGANQRAGNLPLLGRKRLELARALATSPKSKADRPSIKSIILN